MRAFEKVKKAFQLLHLNLKVL